MKMILPLWGLITIYARGPFLSRIKLITTVPPSPSLSLCSLFFPPFISPTSTSFGLSHSFANCAIWGAGFKRHLLSNSETERVKKGRLRIYNTHSLAHAHTNDYTCINPCIVLVQLQIPKRYAQKQLLNSDRLILFIGIKRKGVKNKH